MPYLRLIITVVFTLGVESFALHYFMHWSWKKAFLCSVLFNIASIIGVTVAYQYVVMRLPQHWFRLHHLHTQYPLHELVILGTSLIAIIVVEGLLVKLFEKEAGFGRILAVVALMNIVTFAPGAIEQYVRDIPAVPEPFTLTAAADWIDVNDTIYYFDFNDRTVVRDHPMSPGREPYHVHPPMYGYRVDAGGSAVASLAPTNMLSIGVIDSNGTPVRTAEFPCDATNSALVAVAPDCRWAAAWDNNVLDVSPLGATGVEPVFVAVTGVTDIAWSADGSQLVCHTTGATVTLSAGTWTPTAPQSPPALAPAWHWSLQMFMATSSTYLAGSTTAVVSQIDGVTVLTPTSSNTFKVAGAGNFRACVGVGFLSDNSTLLFSMRHERGWELLALDTRTWRVGHVGDGVMCVLENDEYALPFTRD